MSKIDDAVEAAWDAWQATRDGNVVVPAVAMRAAILAAMPVLLGEPVAWLAGAEHFYNKEAARRHLAVWRKTGDPQPLYAPSLGEGQ